LFKSCSWQEIYDTDDDNFLLHDIRHECKKLRDITLLKVVSNEKQEGSGVASALGKFEDVVMGILL
jgi:hypothetical protein